MAGIYIHIPYCRNKCSYCSFLTSTCFKSKNDLIKAEIKELTLQKDYLDKENISTIYFGGGTPSLLETSDIEKYLKTISKNYKLCQNPEITIECNPEDITTIEKINSLKNIGINRFSIGIQTFNEKFLKLLNRHNTLVDIKNCLENIKNADICNYNLDLIFGIPTQTKKDLQLDVDRILEIKPPHISCYCLAIEDKTLLKYKINTGSLKHVDDDTLADQFEYIDNILTKNGYIHYEISNFCKPGYESKHNLGYWNGTKYLGIGPSAHSYNGTSRQYNINNIYKYIIGINNNKVPSQIEILTNKDKINDYIFTHLRTNNGINIDYLNKTFGYEINENMTNDLKNNEYITINKPKLKLTIKGMLISDWIIKKLLV